MLRNIEIKAKVRDLQYILAKAKELSGSDGELIPQHDTFYNARRGRLKLRRFSDGSSCLVFYDRPDTDGPKLSEYVKCDLPKPSSVENQGQILHEALARSIGIKGDLKKIRRLFMVGQTRVHIDDVETLGNFMELEVVLRPEQSLEEGQAIAEDLREKLGVSKEDLMSGAYMDHLLAQQE